MSFLSNLTARLPFSKEEEAPEYFFALNIGPEKLTAGVWTIERSRLKVVSSAYGTYSTTDELIQVTDRLLDEALGNEEIEPTKILFGVPDSWLSGDDLKEQYLKLLRQMVKEMELTPMAYVATSHALIHFLEKYDGVPTTAILVGIEQHHLTVTVTRAGKLDGSRSIPRGDNLGADIEKLLLAFTHVEVLPSKILIYGPDKESLEKQKNELLSYSWMSKLSFLHFPKIESLDKTIELDATSFAGAVELDSNVIFSKNVTPAAVHTVHEGSSLKQEPESEQHPLLPKEERDSEVHETLLDSKEDVAGAGFVVGDIMENLPKEEVSQTEDIQTAEPSPPEPGQENSLGISQEDFYTDKPDQELVVNTDEEKAFRASVGGFGPGNLRFNFRNPLSFGKAMLSGKKVWLFSLLAIVAVLLLGYLFLLKSTVKIFVEPRILERDTQVVADPSAKSVNEETKTIPGQSVDIEVSGSGKGETTGRKQVGDSSKGTAVLRNKTDEGKTFAKNTILTSSGGMKFSLDNSVTVASKSADDGTWGKATASVTAVDIGADGNLPSGTDFTVNGFSSSQYVAKSEGNFSGGTSKEVAVVSDADQKKLLASVASGLRTEARDKLQAKYPDKKILEEALLEEIVRKTYSKNINDQATDFSLNLTIRYKGTAFDDKDLRSIVSKLVSTNVPEDFELDLAETETQADVSKLEKDGKLIFLARFKAKLLPKLDTQKIKQQIRGRTSREAAEILRGYENILGSEISTQPSLPALLQRLPLLDRNINIEVGLK
ncbi:hypothetical protein HY387_00035 [Candidatus Daviesbacteria bacterium]|nr:hypothetical protein [Candidatus Daviesbacteria bacterium]